MQGRLAKELEVACTLARQAGELLLGYYDSAYDVIEKPAGGGPVTVADERANELLVTGLKKAFPHDGVVAEETKDTSDAGRYERCWFVDPLDGTREFIRHNGEFAVHVGLAIGGEAVLGVVYRPVGKRLYAGVIGEGCYLETPRGGRIPCRTADGDPASLRLVVSRSHPSPRLEQIREELGISTVLSVGSVGVKCSLLVEGKADLYVHASRVGSRWDSCAPEAVVRAAGGVFTDMAGAPYRYDGTEIVNRRGMVAACNPGVLAWALPAIERVGREAGIL